MLAAPQALCTELPHRMPFRGNDSRLAGKVIKLPWLQLQAQSRDHARQT